MTPCRCWLCNGPARLKLVAYVERPPLSEPVRAIHAAFWSRIGGGARRGR